VLSSHILSSYVSTLCYHHKLPSHIAIPCFNHMLLPYVCIPFTVIISDDNMRHHPSLRRQWPWHHSMLSLNAIMPWYRPRLSPQCNHFILCYHPMLSPHSIFLCYNSMLSSHVITPGVCLFPFLLFLKTCVTPKIFFSQ
jgi:hypothetical protein